MKNSTNRKKHLKVGVIAPKNTQGETDWLISNINASAEPYRRGFNYDIVCFVNLTDEVRTIKSQTDCQIMAVCMEPEYTLKINYDSNLLKHCNFYMGYRNFAGNDFSGEFKQFIFPAATIVEVEHQFEINLQSKRTYDFFIVANHDPNIRKAIGSSIRKHKSLLKGPLFNTPKCIKLPFQRQCRFEFITENDINDYYFSEKLAQAIFAGCVPVYYGCKKIKDHIPNDLFIDLHDWPINENESCIEEVIKFCLKPGVYERYFENIKAHGRDFLLKHSTWDINVFKPLNDYLLRLEEDGFRSRRKSLLWKFVYLKQAVKSFAKPLLDIAR